MSEQFSLTNDDRRKVLNQLSALGMFFLLLQFEFSSRANLLFAINVVRDRPSSGVGNRHFDFHVWICLSRSRLRFLLRQSSSRSPIAKELGLCNVAPPSSFIEGTYF